MKLVIGTANADIFYGSAGDEDFDGLGGGDFYFIGPDQGFDRFFDSGTDGIDRIFATEPGMEIGLGSGFGPDSGIEVISGLFYDDITIRAGSGADSLDFSETELIGIAYIGMGPGDDVVIGSAGDDSIGGNNRNDWIAGGPGDDLLMGGAPNDLDPVRDRFHGKDGDDKLLGGRGHDRLYGGEGDDHLEGNTGDDLLVGGIGADTLVGGWGSDCFVFRTVQEGGDTIRDFRPGTDCIDLSAIDADLAVAGNQSFLFAGEAEAAVPNAVSFYLDGDTTVVLADVDGDAAADLTLTLLGAPILSAEDFIL